MLPQVIEYDSQMDQLSNIHSQSLTPQKQVASDNPFHRGPATVPSLNLALLSSQPKEETRLSNLSLEHQDTSITLRLDTLDK